MAFALQINEALRKKMRFRTYALKFIPTPPPPPWPEEGREEGKWREMWWERGEWIRRNESGINECGKYRERERKEGR